MCESFLPAGKKRGCHRIRFCSSPRIPLQDTYDVKNSINSLWQQPYFNLFYRYRTSHFFQGNYQYDLSNRNEISVRQKGAAAECFGDLCYPSELILQQPLFSSARHADGPWSRRESNPCPKASPLSFYYHSQLFDILSGRRQLTAFCLQ